MSSEQGPDRCADGRDNDGDGFVDCGDSDCGAYGPCPEDGGSSEDASPDAQADVDAGSGSGAPCRGWARELVAADGALHGAALALSREGVPHVVFGRAWGPLLHAERGEVGWEVDAIDDEGGYFPSVVLGDDGLLEVAYAVRGGGPEVVRFAHEGVGGWSAEAIANASADSIDLALSPQGGTDVAFATPDGIWNAVAEGGEWTVEEVAAGSATGASIVVRPDGTISIAWLAGPVAGPFRLSISSDEGGVWETTELEQNVDGRAPPSLAIDSDGTLGLCFVASGPVVTCGRRDVDGAWRLEEVDANATTRLATRIREGVQHVAYSTGREVRYATKLEGLWHIEHIDDREMAGAWDLDLVLGPDGSPHIAYGRYPPKSAESLDPDVWYAERCP